MRMGTVGGKRCGWAEVGRQMGEGSVAVGHPGVWPRPPRGFAGRNGTLCVPKAEGKGWQGSGTGGRGSRGCALPLLGFVGRRKDPEISVFNPSVINNRGVQHQHSHKSHSTLNMSPWLLGGHELHPLVFPLPPQPNPTAPGDPTPLSPSHPTPLSPSHPSPSQSPGGLGTCGFGARGHKAELAHKSKLGTAGAR